MNQLYSMTSQCLSKCINHAIQDLFPEALVCEQLLCQLFRVRLHRKQVFPVQLMMAESCLFSDFRKSLGTSVFGLPGKPADVMIERDCPAVGRSLPYCGHSDAEP